MTLENLFNSHRGDFPETKTTVGNNPFAYKGGAKRRMLQFQLKFLLVLAFFTGLAGVSFSQTYPINSYNGQTVTTCSGTFYDSGGSLGDYGNNENYTVTFCSGNGNSVMFDFSVFTVRTGDTLYVYDGPDITSPLKGKYSNTVTPGSLTSSGTCMTFNFVSNNIFTRPGWVAGISCCIPPVTSAITPSDPYQCAGSTITYSVDLHAGSTYDWSVIHGTPASTIGGTNSLDVTWDPAGDITGYVKVVETNSCGSKDSSQLIVDIYSLPVVNFSGLASYYCIYSAPVTLTGSPAGGTFSGPGISGNVFTPASAGAGTHSITYVYTDPVTLCTNQSIHQTIVVNPQVFIVGASSNSYCSGSGVTITLSGSESGVNYQLLKGAVNDGSPLPGTGSSLSWSNRQVGVYTVIATNSLTSCTANMSGTQTITENPLPTPTFITQAGPTTCSSMPVLYSTQPGQSNYTWGFTGIPGTDYSILSGGTSTDDKVSLIWLTAGSRSVTVNYTGTNGCTAASPVSSNSTAVTLSPAAPTGTATQNFCSETFPTVAGLSATGTGILWYAAASGGSPLASSAALANNTHYFASQTVSGCESVNRFDVTAFIYSIPAAPSAVAGSGATCSQITAGWTVSAGATSYRLDVSTNIGFTSYVTGYQDRNTGNVTSLNVTGLTSGMIYYYRVRAVGFCGASPNSNIITYSTLPAAPSTPGTISGITAQCATLTGQSYSITSVPNATAYTWSVPTGWSITSGQGTTAITVTTGGIGQDGNITVAAGNTCGTGSPSTLAVIVSPYATVTSVTGTSPMCISGTANYTANGVVSGGGIGSWSSSNTTVATVSAIGVVTAVSAGTCNITYTITGGCGGTVSAQRALTVNPNAAVSLVTGTSSLCIGGTATFTASGIVTGGGTGAWTSSNTAIATVNSSGLVTGVSAGTCNIIYTVTGGCGGTASAQLSLTISPNAAVSSITGVSPLCIGGTASYIANGVILSGGTGAWSSSNTAVATVNASGLVTAVSAGNCNIVYTITGGCGTTVSSQRTLSVNPNAAVSSVTGTTPLCVGGTAVFAASGTVLSGGTGTWSSSNNAVATVTAAGLVTAVSAGTCNIIYTITGGCGGTVSAQSSLTINPNASITSVTGPSPLCISGSGTFSANGVVAGGGTGTWSSSNPSVATVNSSGLVTGVSAGTCNIIYAISGGCGSTVSAQQSVTISPNATVATVTGISPLCIGGTTTYSANGVVLSGGTGAWSSSNPAVAVVNAAGQVVAVSAGTCNIIFTITGGCGGTVSAQRTLTVNPNSAITSVTGASPVCLATTTVFTANGVVPGGGTGSWSSSNSSIASVTSAGVVTGISAGTCNIIYTITGGCGGKVSAQRSVTVSPNATVASVTGTSPLCLGATFVYTATGIVLSGGTGSWSSSDPSIATVNTTGLVTAVSAGTCNIAYTITGGCGGTVTALKSLTVIPNAAVSSVSGTSPLCTGKTATFTATGAVLGGGTGAWSSSNPGVATVSSTGVVNGISAGSCNIYYTITGGCGGVASAFQTVTITDSPVATISYSGSPWCSNATSKTVTMTGTSGGTYSASPAGLDIDASTGTIYPATSTAATYTVSYTMTSAACGNVVATTSVTILQIPSLVIHDPAAVCAPSTVDITAAEVTAGSSAGLVLTYWKDAAASILIATPQNSTSGTYYIKGTDLGGCYDIKPVHAVVNPLPSVSGTKTDVLCSGMKSGSIDITATGGSGTYSYTWTGSGVTTGSEDQTGLGAGTYDVFVTDAAGCSSPQVHFTITESPALGGSINLQTNVTVYGGNDGSVTVGGSGGTPAYMYSLDGGVFQISGIFGSLVAGTYTVTVRDNNLCTYDVQVIITQPAPPLTLSVISQTNVACKGGSSGMFTVAGTGGTQPYEFSADGGAWQSSGAYLNLGAGTYVVTIRDAALITSHISVTISEPSDAVSGIPSVTGVLCYGTSTGAIDLTVTGGVSPYTFLWSNNATTEDLTDLPAGEYNVTITDANNCTQILNVTVIQSVARLSGTIDSHTDATCAGSEDGSVTISGSGGTTPYEFSLDGNGYQSSGTFSLLSPGGHTVTIRDAGLCTTDVMVNIAEPTPVLIASSKTDVSCPGENNGSLTITVSGGTAPYAILWDNGTTITSRQNLENGSYGVVVTDANGCATSATLVVGVTGGEGCLVIPTIITPNADGYNDTWIIENIDLFPNAELFVYNRWGELVFHSRNILGDPWDGTSGGKKLPTDSYHYILHLGNGKTMSGVISIIR